MSQQDKINSGENKSANNSIIDDFFADKDHKSPFSVAILSTIEQAKRGKRLLENSGYFPLKPYTDKPDTTPVTKFGEQVDKYILTLDKLGKVQYYSGKLAASLPHMIYFWALYGKHASSDFVKGMNHSFGVNFNPDAIKFLYDNKLQHREMFIPEIMIPTINSLNLDEMKNQGFDGLVMDFETTIGTAGDNRIHPRLLEKVAEMVKVFGEDKIIILSNYAGTKADKFGYANKINHTTGEQLRTLGIELKLGGLNVLQHTTKKPGHIPEVQEQLNLPSNKIAMIGNKSLTDIAYANNEGMLGIMVVYFPPEIKKDYNCNKQTGDGFATRNDAKNILYMVKGGFLPSVKAPKKDFADNFDAQKIAPGNIIPIADEMKSKQYDLAQKLVSFLTLGMAGGYYPTGFVDTLYVDDGTFHPLNDYIPDVADLIAKKFNKLEDKIAAENALKTYSPKLKTK